MSDSTSSLLDSIDGALRDYETSADAMRWAPPEGRDSAAYASLDDPAADLDARILAWAIGSAEAYMTQMRQLAEVCWPTLAEAGKRLCELIGPVLRMIADAEESRRRAGSAMRCEYRRRTLARRRRRR